MNNYKTQPRGFIALLSAIIISAALLSLLFTTNASSFFARFDALERQYKRSALGLAESCANSAMLKLSQNFQYDLTLDPTYIAGQRVREVVGDGYCYIRSLTPGAPRSGATAQVTLVAQGVYKYAYSTVTLGLTVHNLPAQATVLPLITVTSWQETQ